MPDSTKKPVTQPVVTIPGLAPVPVVAVRLPNGAVALRHPAELVKPTSQPPAGAGK